MFLSAVNGEMILLNPICYSSSSVDGAVAVLSSGAAAIEWNHSPTVSPQRDRPTYDVVEVSINRTVLYENSNTLSMISFEQKQ